MSAAALARAAWQMELSGSGGLTGLPVRCWRARLKWRKHAVVNRSYEAERDARCKERSNYKLLKLWRRLCCGTGIVYVYLPPMPVKMPMRAGGPPAHAPCGAKALPGRMCRSGLGPFCGTLGTSPTLWPRARRLPHPRTPPPNAAAAKNQSVLSYAWKRRKWSVCISVQQGTVSSPSPTYDR